MNRKRFELALERLKGEDWKRFEEFASAFLVTDYPDLRTVASPAGDEGRDAELFSPEGYPNTVFQFSVTKAWPTKLRNTVGKIAKNLPSAKILCYVTNQSIGATADKIRHELRGSHKIFVDLMDRSYFLDRYCGDPHRETLSEGLAQDVVDPYLESRGIIEGKGQALSSLETRTALVFLGLQWEDDTQAKGLTKLAFDALVRSVLRFTDSQHRLSRAEIQTGVLEILPSHDGKLVREQTDRALSRLTKKIIRHWPQHDEFCLTHEERETLKSRLAEIEQNDLCLNGDIRRVIDSLIPLDTGMSETEADQMASVTRKVLETFLLNRGELFALALTTGKLSLLGFHEIRETALQYRQEVAVVKHCDPVDLISTAVEQIIVSSGEAVAAYLRNLADAYTLLAFLKQTPDVQAVARKMFREGEIWLDTSILIPVIAEDIVPPEEWRFRKMINIATDAGLKFRVTSGVLEELERNMNRALACSRCGPKEWKGTVPFLISFFVEKGRATNKFNAWLENFRGDTRPIDDIAEYLHVLFGIQRGSLEADYQSAQEDLRRAVKEIWIDIHETRRTRGGVEFDPILVQRLADHDAENYVGVIQRRGQKELSAFGYTCWWLTLDHMAFEIANRLEQYLQGKPPNSPVMSADFLSNYLSFGPIRAKAARSAQAALPVALDPALVRDLTPELLELANQIRESCKGLPELVIRRKVRDGLDEARRRVGPIAMRGLRVLSEAVDIEIT